MSSETSPVRLIWQISSESCVRQCTSGRHRMGTPAAKWASLRRIGRDTIAGTAVKRRDAASAWALCVAAVSRAVAAWAIVFFAGFADADNVAEIVFDEPSADPFVLPAGPVTYLFTTNSRRGNVPAYRSLDLLHWTALADAMPSLPRWAKKGFTWAPEIVRYADRYWLFYTARAQSTTLPCIGLASAERPEGPYHDPAEEPLLCMDEAGGAIDASPYLEGETLYLLWKANGNRLKIKTKIMLARIDPVERKLLGVPAVLIENDMPWEGISVEAPTLIRHNGQYHLFYSGAMFHSARYAVGYAIADTIDGPYRKCHDNPILASSGPRVAPGHQAIFRHRDGQYWIAYHAYPGAIKGEKRTTRLARLKQPERRGAGCDDSWTILAPEDGN